MAARLHLLLAVFRFYIALFPSYLHPDENFQGPEVIAGRVFPYTVHETWEFTSARPIRSAFTLWPPYGLPMLVLKWLWEGSGNGLVKPSIVFWTLRGIMFTLSFVLEDGAIHELIDSPRERKIAVLLVASSYVTWSWQVHTFSNAVETLVLLWSLVLIKRTIRNCTGRSSFWSPCTLAFLIVFGTFNRITFPAYLAMPAFQLLPTFRKRPTVFLLMMCWALFFTAMAIFVDTIFYHPRDTPISYLFSHPIVAPLNSLLYNSQSKNLAVHGTHPFYQHIAINLPQLLGPALPLVVFARQNTIRVASALSGIAILSLFPHQEARFLLPTVPLLLSSIRLPRSITKPFVLTWIMFNASLGLLMGVYHQGGVFPAQMWLETQDSISQVFWWKTYSPPTWLLNGRNNIVSTVDLMGLSDAKLVQTICTSPLPVSGYRVIVAPTSARFLDQFKGVANSSRELPTMLLSERWSYRRHINLDDLDIGEDGAWDTWTRVVGRRGLKVWSVECSSPARAYHQVGHVAL